jgi:hypothetical protein
MSRLSATSTSTSGSAGAEQRSVEAMVMSIPFVNKLRVLEKVSPPLPGGGRGPVIAIEGSDPALVELVGRVVERALSGSDDCDLRVWSSSKAAQSAGQAGDGKMPSEQHGSSSNLFGAYLGAILDWHARSADIIRHIYRRPDGPPADGQRQDRLSVSSLSRRNSAADTIPVALLTGGFSLSLSDQFACRVPIADSYAPVDHWQWMATLWRGIVGPDLVVYARPVVVAHNFAVDSKGFTSAMSEEAEALMSGALQSVEAKTPGVMIVRARVPPTGDVERGLDEKTQRRLAFEVVEWVRASGFKGR